MRRFLFICLMTSPSSIRTVAKIKAIGMVKSNPKMETAGIENTTKHSRMIKYKYDLNFETNFTTDSNLNVDLRIMNMLY